MRRRTFIYLTGGALVLPKLAIGEKTVPSQLDHILLGCSDLQQGIDFVEQRTGVRGEFGGVHPGRGTQNALLSLGERRYLEIMAPDPAQPDSTNPLARHLKTFAEPRLVGWAAHPGSLDTFADRLRKGGVAFEGPTPGSRQRADGSVLKWRTLTLKDNPAWLLPFFIEWSTDAIHPSVEAPAGCRLVAFDALSPNPEELASRFRLLGLDVSVVKDEAKQLRAMFAGSKGELKVHS